MTESSLGKFGVDRIGLFGSFASGEQKENSDIDLLVHFQKRPTFSEEGRMMTLIEGVFEGRKVDIVNIEDLKAEFRDSIFESVVHV